MRTDAAFATVSVAVFVGLGHAVDPVTLSLRWLDKQAYVANVTIDAQPTLLQVGTYNMDTWVACDRFGNRSCDVAARSIGTIGVENGVADVSFLNSKTLGIKDADGSKTVVFSNSASMYRAEYNDSMAAELPLVGNDTQGVLGLGPYNGLACSGLNGSCSNISLYLSSNSDGAGSFVKIGGDTSSGFSTSSGSTTQYSMAVRSTDEQGWRNKRWYLSLLGVRFGDNKPMYPRVYSSVDTPGADAKALVSLNHATLQMPPALHSKFMASYLSACRGFKTYAMGWYYECDASVMNSLPRLSLYVMDKVFYLDPTDYTQASSVDTAKVLVLVASSGLDDSWVFGAPFLRKFPSIFSVDTNTIDLFCSVGSSCRVESGVLDREAVDSTGGSQDSGSSSPGSSSPGIGSRTTYGPATSAPPSYEYTVQDSWLWLTWIIKCMGFLMVFIIVARAVRRCRGRRQAADRELAMQQTGRNGDTGTVASERDLEEAKEDLRRMLAEEEASATAIAASRNDADFVALQSPGSVSPPRSPSTERRS